MSDSWLSPAPPYVEIFTDGGCEPNPGLGGYGVVLAHPRKRAEIGGGFRKTTNSRLPETPDERTRTALNELLVRVRMKSAAALPSLPLKPHAEPAPNE